MSKDIVAWLDIVVCQKLGLSSYDTFQPHHFWQGRQCKQSHIIVAHSRFFSPSTELSFSLSLKISLHAHSSCSQRRTLRFAALHCFTLHTVVPLASAWQADSLCAFILLLLPYVLVLALQWYGCLRCVLLRWGVFVLFRIVDYYVLLNFGCSVYALLYYVTWFPVLVSLEAL